MARVVIRKVRGAVEPGRVACRLLRESLGKGFPVEEPGSAKALR